ncbi:pyridoxamine 5'-phosphate oxidase family protein [Waterburya agarophytonicola K14]|uniref:Pyridoxamine 5'-phosphate oxidase family protein n=1 Tax=Waterburya agarophytonicola KI4 TaxID=2874699 RepID=A0A964BSZ3_9CYAN|nr:Npun_F5749 family FMN-dependent PPOX-type flavoprotein [Waterburya agarophytonicola]MCC0177290.1 pyridoxamine 5'-phosphate oxidase family protein [Waterburya agarophytonicola KI4]
MLPPWRSPLSSAIYRNRSKPHSRYFQLATVTPEGYPANRTVVFRGFLDDKQSSLKIITDLRSAKIEDIAHNSRGEICWYFTKTREQFRIRGNLRLVKTQEKDLDLQKARQITWHNLSDSARSQFTWADLGQSVGDRSAFDVEPLNPNLPLDNFCLLLLIPQKIDHLQLKGDPQQRCLYKLEKDSTWSNQLINHM